MPSPNNNARIHRACGKFILVGEHFILYDTPALAMPWLDVEVTLTPSSPQPPPLAIIQEAWEKAHNLIAPAKAPTTSAIPFPYSLASTIPLGAGFGSSAALCLCLLDAVAEKKEVALSPEERVKKATELEGIFHGRSSGLDPMVVAMRQAIRFTLSQGAQALPWKLEDVGFVLATSTESRQTSRAVALVRKFAEEKPKLFQKKLEAANNLINAAELLITAKPSKETLPPLQRAKALGLHLDANHVLLRDVGVSTPSLERLVEVAKKHGAYGAKISGAGLGGSILALAPLSQLPSIKEALLQENVVQASIALPPRL